MAIDNQSLLSFVNESVRPLADRATGLVLFLDHHWFGPWFPKWGF